MTGVLVLEGRERGSLSTRSDDPDEAPVPLKLVARVEGEHWVRIAGRTHVHGGMAMEELTAGTPNLQTGSILVYDDDRLLLDVLVTMLRRQGHQVRATQSEQEAIALARAEHFDLVVVDLGRRRSKGYDLVRVVSATSPETPIVAMSAYPAQEVVRFAREHAHAFLEKPFSLAELVDVVRCFLAQGKPARERVRVDCPSAPYVRVAGVGS